MRRRCTVVYFTTNRLRLSTVPTIRVCAVCGEYVRTALHTASRVPVKKHETHIDVFAKETIPQSFTSSFVNSMVLHDSMELRGAPWSSVEFHGARWNLWGSVEYSMVTHGLHGLHGLRGILHGLLTDNLTSCRILTSC